MENNLIDIMNYISESDGMDLKDIVLFCINENKLETFEKFQNTLIKIYEEEKED